ncbi:MAG: hypothetical protein ACJ74Q_15385 [Pyrinomonadaceae bacterium]
MNRRAPAGMTYDACHGCGNKVLHDKGQVCDDCQKAIRFGSEYKAEHDARVASFVRVRLPRKGWALYAGQTDEMGRACGLLVEALRAAFEPDPEKRYGSEYLLGREGHDWWDTFLIPAQAVPLFKDLDRAIKDGAQAEYDYGVGEGRNMLKQLATGSLPMEEFDSVPEDLRRRAEERRRRRPQRRRGGK